jgi:tol-pal system protein YbgF
VRTRWIAFALAAFVFGALGGAMFAPQPAVAVSRDMVELQQSVQQIQQGQQDLRSTVDANNATIKTLIQQSLDSVNQMNVKMADVQKTVQEVQANTGSRIDTMTTQTQGLSDNLQDMQSRVGKLSQQMTDMQNLLQSIDSKVSSGAVGAPAIAPTGGPGGAPNYSPQGGSTGGAPNAGNPNAGAPPNYGTPTNYGAPPAYTPASGAGSQPGAAPGSMQPGALPPISADTLYKNALRDFTSGNYDLSHQEFADYIRNFPTNDLASNSQFYLGEIAYAQSDYKNAITAYDTVLQNYPQSFKLASSMLKKAQAELQMGMKTTGERDLREVIRRFPGSDESRRAQAKLRELGVPVTPRATAPH